MGQFSSIASVGGPACRPVMDYTSQSISVAQFLYQLRDGPLQAGDLVFTIGKSLASQLTIWGSWSKFSHVMMVDRDPSNRDMHAFMWESVSDADTLIDVHTNSNIKKGVRLVLAEARLLTAGQRDGRSSMTIGLVRLHMPRTNSKGSTPEALRLAFYRALSTLEGREYPKPYERDKRNLVAVQYSKLVGENPRDNSEYFCSELMAETYRMLRIIREDTNTSMISPKNLAEHLNAIHCINGFILGPELYMYTVLIPPPSTTATTLSRPLPPPEDDPGPPKIQL